MNARPRTPLSVFTILHPEAHIRRTHQRILHHRHDLVIQTSSHKNWKQQIKKERNDGDRCTDSSKETTSLSEPWFPPMWSEYGDSYLPGSPWGLNVQRKAMCIWHILHSHKRFCLALFLFLWEIRLSVLMAERQRKVTGNTHGHWSYFASEQRTQH